MPLSSRRQGGVCHLEQRDMIRSGKTEKRFAQIATFAELSTSGELYGAGSQRQFARALQQGLFLFQFEMSLCPTAGQAGGGARQLTYPQNTKDPGCCKDASQTRISDAILKRASPRRHRWGRRIRRNRRAFPPLGQGAVGSLFRLTWRFPELAASLDFVAIRFVATPKEALRPDGSFRSQRRPLSRRHQFRYVVSPPTRLDRLECSTCACSTNSTSPGPFRSQLNRSGSGPIFGGKTSLLRKSVAENLDLTPSGHLFNGPSATV